MSETESPATVTAIVIPADLDGPILQVQVPTASSAGLETMQRLVGGYVQMLPLPDFIEANGRAAAFLNEEGKMDDLPLNERGTAFLVPGVGLLPGDYIVGDLVLTGIDEEGGLDELPQAVLDRVRLIRETM